MRNWITLLFCATLAFAQKPLLKDGGFEEDGLKSWHLFTHSQDNFVTIVQDAVDYTEGLNSIRVNVGQHPRIYVGFNQHVPLPKGNTIRRVSFQARIPAKQKIQVFLFCDPKLPSSSAFFEGIGDWKKYSFEPNVPPTTQSCRLEFRFTSQGEFRVDDIKLEADVLNPLGKANRYLFINKRGNIGVAAGAKISPLLKEALTLDGDEIFDYCQWEEFGPERLKYVRCVFYSPMLRMSANNEDLAKFKLLEDFVRDGGAFVICNRGDQMYAQVIYPILLMERFGAKVNLQYIQFPKEDVRMLGKEGGDTYAYVREVRGECKDGVEQMLLPAGTNGSFVGCIPFQGDSNWKVMLYANKGSEAKPIFEKWGLEFYQRYSGEGADYSDGIPMVGYRDFGKGRIAYLGMNDDLYAVGSKGSQVDTDIMEKVYEKGFDGPESHLVKFMHNLAKCITYNRELLTNKEYPKSAKSDDDKFDSRQYKGIIGPRTTYSIGKSTPAEYVAEAKKLGLDFVVFLEDFENLSYEDFEALRKECINFTKDGFCAMAGFTYKNIDGNNQYIYGNEPMYPGAKVLSQDGKRFNATYFENEKRASGNDLFYIYTMLSFLCNSGWYNFSANPYPYYDMRSVCGMGLVTQEDGKTIDFAADAYAGTNRDEQYIIPQAITLMKSASEMELVKNGTYYHNEIGADSFKQMIKCLSSHASRSAKNRYPGMPCYGRTIVSQGPKITIDMPRGDMNPSGDAYSTVLNHWPLSLSASAETNIISIEIYDGITLIRSFTPNAKEFSYNATLPNNFQHHIWARLKTADGKLAFTRSISSDSWLMRDHYCMDRNNPLYYSRQQYKDGSQCLTTYAADSTTPWKGPWLGRVRPVGFFVEDSRLGTGKLRYDGSPEYHPTMWMVPGIYDENGNLPPSLPYGSWQGPLVAGVEGGIHNHPVRILYSSDVHIADQVMDGVFAPDAAPILFTHYSLFPVFKSNYLDTTARKTLYRLQPGGMSTYLWEQDFTVLKELKHRPNGLSVKIGRIAPNGGNNRYGFIGGKRKPLDGKDELNRGDFIIYQGNSYGTLVVFVLSDGIKMDDALLAFKADGDVPAGTKYHARFLFVGMNKLVEDPYEAALKFGKDFGIHSQPTYKVNAPNCEITGNDFELKVKGQFVGSIAGLDKMDANLPVVLSDMRDNASVILRCSEGIRVLGQAEHKAYALLTPRENAKPLFIGHPVLTDNPSVCVTISMKEDYSTWQLEFHNPTNAEIKTRAKATNGSGLNLNMELILPPGGSKFCVAVFEN